MVGAERHSGADWQILLTEHPDLTVMRNRIGDFTVIKDLNPWTQIVIGLNPLDKTNDEIIINARIVKDKKWSEITSLVIKPVSGSKNGLKIYRPNPDIDPQEVITDILDGIEIFDSYLQDSDPKKKLNAQNRVQDQTQNSDYEGGHKPKEKGGYWTQIGPILRKPLELSQ